MIVVTVPEGVPPGGQLILCGRRCPSHLHVRELHRAHRIGCCNTAVGYLARVVSRVDRALTATVLYGKLK
jgi:hypothetical protein